MVNTNQAKPLQPFYNLSVVLNNGETLAFSSLKGKKILLVNTASDCGFTPQYNDLEKLYRENRDRLIIIGFPANDFGQQEKGSDEVIAAFCKVNFGISFPLAKKSTVIKSPDQNLVYRWLTDASLNGWNNQQPAWNFSKYLVDENGILTNYFDAAVSPWDDNFKKALER